MADFFAGFEERRIATSGAEINLAVWRDHADTVTGEAIASGHFLPEEAPDDTYRALRAFFA